MGKRLKRVYSSADQVLHLWADQSQSDARSSNVFFEGDTCFSYGYHYRLGKLHKVGKNTVALVNSYNYSITTAKHRGWAFDAVEHLPRLYSSNVQCIFTAVDENQERLVDALMGIFSQHSFRRPWDNPNGMPYRIEATLKDVAEFNFFCDAVKLSKLRIDIPIDFLELINNHVDACIERKKELEARRLTPEYISKREAKKAREEERKKEKLKEDIAKWKSGGVLDYRLRDLNPQLIRVRGDVVETTRGAQVPLSHAKRLLGILNSGKKIEGERVGHFQVNADNGDTIRIGCHTIAIEDARAVLQ